MPDSIGNLEATTFGISAATAMQAINHNLGVPWPDEPSAVGPSSTPGPAILIYVSSTSAGLFALQVAKLRGLSSRHYLLATFRRTPQEVRDLCGCRPQFAHGPPRHQRKRTQISTKHLTAIPRAPRRPFCCKAIGSGRAKSSRCSIAAHPRFQTSRPR
jgi:hypothetical protein